MSNIKIHLLFLHLTVGLSFQQKLSICAVSPVGTIITPLEVKLCRYQICRSATQLVANYPYKNARNCCECFKALFQENSDECVYKKKNGHCPGCIDKMNVLQKIGSPMEDGCVKKICQKDGHWVPDPDKIISTCKKCNACGDPHFIAFSTTKFSWQNACNYALVQSDNSPTPEFGVFMDFKKKKPNSVVAYIGAPTIYQEDLMTKVVLTPGNTPSELFNVAVNMGAPQVISTNTPTLLGPPSAKTTVYAWKHGPCVRLYGKPKILVELCETSISIWAPPYDAVQFPYTLGGLCGSTDSKTMKDKQLVGKDGIRYDPVGGLISFAISWKAKQQTKPTCKQTKPNGKKKRSIMELISEETAAGQIRMKCDIATNLTNGEHHDKCLDVHKGNGCTGDDHLGFCKFDLCIAVMDPHQNTEFGITEQNMLEAHKEAHARTESHNEHTIEFVPDEICGIRNFDGYRPTPIGTNDLSHYGEFPWMVAVLTQGTNEYVAGGSLVHRRVVLTAAHKVHGKSGFVASIGDWDLSELSGKEVIAAQTIKVMRVVIHPDFIRSTHVYNVALLILESNAVLGETVMPICLPEPGQVFDGTYCTVTGWGRDSPKELKKVMVPAVNHNDCQIMLRNTRLGLNFNLHNSFNCAGGEGEDLCEGGSPLICHKPYKPSEYVQMGVVSWGIGCGTKGNPGVYGSVPQTVNWIHDIIRNEATQKWRDDRRCGAKYDPNGEFIYFMAPNGHVAECDPKSSEPCCGEWGYCGLGVDIHGWQHCTCDTCMDFRRC